MSFAIDEEMLQLARERISERLDPENDGDERESDSAAAAAAAAVEAEAAALALRSARFESLSARREEGKQ